eukprot:13600585-Ditylum_brightwellii.AAC.1
MEPVEETELDLLMLKGKHTKTPGKDETTLHSETNRDAEKKLRHKLAVEDKYGDDKKGTTQRKIGNKQEIHSTWETKENESKTKRNAGENKPYANIERNLTITRETSIATPRVERKEKPQIVMDTGSEI